MGQVKATLMEYCEAVHPGDDEAQDKLFAQIVDGQVKVSLEEMIETIVKSRGTSDMLVLSKAQTITLITEALWRAQPHEIAAVAKTLAFKHRLLHEQKELIPMDPPREQPPQGAFPFGNFVQPEE